QTTETYQNLKALAKEIEVVEEEPVLLSNEFSNLKNNPALLHLETHFESRPTPQYDSNEQPPIEVAEAVHTRAEAEGVAQEILKLVREQNNRYNDCVILMRDSSTYNTLIKRVFSVSNITIFIDEIKSMLNHPLIKFSYILF